MNLDGKTIAITGGTGSFGGQVLRRFQDSDIDEIRIFSRDEKKQEDMRIALGDHRIKFYLGDVRSYRSVERAFRGVDFVFHAAALKQVPSCEFYPLEAVQTNVMGADNVLRAAIANGVSKVVLLSTDKAVYPINAMGQTKALMEKVMLAHARSLDQNEITVCATRYGNVMASRGSVIPLFIGQIKSGKPLTVTDPNMTRFLMSLEDSVELVLHSFEHANQGDIFVQKAPAATVGDLAEALRQLFGQADEPVVIGTRHGEKLFESLISREEMARVQDMGRYFRIPSDDRDLNYGIFVNHGQESVSSLDDYTSHNTERLGVEQVKELLLTLDYVRSELASAGVQ